MPSGRIQMIMRGGRRKGKKKRYRKLSRILKIQLILQTLIICAAVFYVKYWDSLQYYINTVKELYEEAEMIASEISEDDFGVGKSRVPSASSVAYAEDGTTISVWKASWDSCYVSLSDIPQAVIDAMVCTEDKRFYQHGGVDYKALLRAFFEFVRNRGEITQGGSTITMQLARTKYLTQEVSWQRKVKEIFLAWQLEEKYSKDQIMEFYLNNIYFGNGYYGIGDASRGYFGKDIEELDLAQLIYLCAIPNNPTVYNPLTNSDNTDKRKVRILDQMLEDGYLSEEDYSTASSAVIALAEPEVPEKAEKNDYVESYTAYCAVHALMKLSGFTFCYDFQDNEQRRLYEMEYAKSYAACQELLYKGGYSIYTSLDLDMQRQLQDSLDRELSGYTETNEEGVYTFQGAAVCIDNATGYVKAIVGGRSQDYDFNTFNRAYQSFRQPGSSIKPLIVYTPMFEGTYTPDTMVVDEPIPDGPRNATRNYEGRVTVRRAVEQSINTVAWKLFEELTPETGLSYLTEMEFSKIYAEDYDLPSALGGFTIGVSPLEMAAAFAAIENEGVFRSPTCIVRIVDADGKVIYEPDSSGKRVYTQEAANIMDDVLTGVMENGTGKPVKLDDVLCAGKTGTTNDDKDSWFVGYTEYYTTSVWVGYDMPRQIAGLTGPAYSGFIWKDFMEAVHENKSANE